jgi:hypothetical protein
MKFANMGQNVSNIAINLMNNQNLDRLICYLDDTPLDATKTDIVVKSIEDVNFILTPLDISVVSELQLNLFIHPFSGSLKLAPLSTDIIVIDIVCPYTFWTLKGQGELRPFLIASECAKALDGQNEIAGWGKINLYEWKEIKVNPKNGCISLFLNVKNSTLKAGGVI